MDNHYTCYNVLKCNVQNVLVFSIQLMLIVYNITASFYHVLSFESWNLIPSKDEVQNPENVFCMKSSLSRPSRIYPGYTHDNNCNLHSHKFITIVNAMTS